MSERGRCVRGAVINCSIVSSVAMTRRRGTPGAKSTAVLPRRSATPSYTPAPGLKAACLRLAVFCVLLVSTAGRNHWDPTTSRAGAVLLIRDATNMSCMTSDHNLSPAGSDSQGVLMIGRRRSGDRMSRQAGACRGRKPHLIGWVAICKCSCMHTNGFNTTVQNSLEIWCIVGVQQLRYKFVSLPIDVRAQHNIHAVLRAMHAFVSGSSLHHITVSHATPFNCVPPEISTKTVLRSRGRTHVKHLLLPMPCCPFTSMSINHACLRGLHARTA